MLTIRPMRADDDLDAELDLRHRAFGPMDTAQRAYWREEMLGCIADGRQFGVWEGGTLLGAARYYDMRQFWLGRPVPMAGVGGVKVAPEARGKGIGKALMVALLDAMAGRGYPLSVLYPATARPYRSLGWEMAGGHYRAEMPARSLGSLLPPEQAAAPAGDVAVRRAGPRDAAQVIEVLAAVHGAARDCGPATFDVATVTRWLASPDLFAYLAADGVLGYGWHRGSKEILVHLLQAGSARTARALWGIVASNASVTEVVHATLGPRDPIGLLLGEPDASLRVRKTWMLRVLDPAAAIAGRGFPAGLHARVALRIADRDRPAGAGRYTLDVRGGRGELTSGSTTPAAGSPASEPVSLGPRGFAALYAGAPMAALRVAGLAADGDPETDAALDAVFACQPYLLDYF